MNKILNAVKGKFDIVKKNAKLKTILISALALLLIVSATLAWYINKVGLWGMEFNTGNIEFNTYVYDEFGNRLVGPISSDDEDATKYLNAPLMTLNNAQVGSSGVAYIAVESTGTLGIQYRIAFDITGRNEKSTAYLGGYKYNISRVTDKVTFNGAGNLNVSNCPRPDKINDDVVTIDRNAVNGTISELNGYDVYRVDYTLVQKNEEYTGTGINIYFNIFATQIGGDFEDDAERGYTYYCSTREDIDRAATEAYPGDLIKLTADIAYYGDLVFNKPVSLETNDFTLTVNGNLMYDYVLGNSLKLDAGGLGTIIVQCTKEGVGGNLQIKAPIGDVTLVGANSANGDIIVEKNITIDATNSYGSAGVSFNEVRIVDLRNSRKTIYLESNTRATVSFGTTIGLIQSVVKANNIEIVNNGVIGEINLSNMNMLSQTNSPQIYILNNNDINNPIMLPTWSVKFVQDASGKCSGNTRIIQSYSGSYTEVTGNCKFVTSDIEVEKKEFLVEQIQENNDSRLKIYYQNVNGENTSIQRILEDYLTYEATTGCKLNEVLELEIISIGDKAVTADDIAFMNSNNMLALQQLDLQRANVTDNKLPNNAFSGVSKYVELVLPQNLVAIGDNAFLNSKIDNIITVPSGVTTFGTNWFKSGRYVGFAASVPVAQAADGMTGAKAVFVDEAYIESYKSVYTKFATQIYPMSVMDETKHHFIRNTMGDEWEITYYITGNDAVIGADIIMDGRKLKITSVYDNAYRHNYTASEVRFADSVANLGAYNFYNNKYVNRVDLNQIKNLGSEVFYTCANLISVDFGEALETIGTGAFYKCTSLEQNVTLPDTMQKINTNAFRETKINSINTGGTMSVDNTAFYDCKSLVSAELPNVSVIAESGGNNVFAMCSSLVSVKMPSLTVVSGEKMFMYCGSLRELYLGIPDDGISLGTNPFQSTATTNLKLFVPEEHLEFFQNKKPGGIVAEKIYPQGEKLGEELVKGFNIGKYIVMDNGDDTYSLVTSNVAHSGVLEIPQSYNDKPITHIYANAFRNQSFTNVTLKLGNTLRSIGNYAFYERTGLLETDFGNSLEIIGKYAFSGCSGMSQAVELPETMQKIDSAAFYKAGIVGVDTGGTIVVESAAFYNATKLVYAKMPNVSIVAETGDNNTFSNCSALISVDMPKVVTVLGKNMFSYCGSLREIYLGSDDAGITLGATPFSGSDATKIKLYVPAELVSFYQGKNFVNTNQVYPRGVKIGNYTWKNFVLGDYVLLENGSGYTLVTSNLEFTGAVTVPNEYNGKPITEIYSNAFRQQTFTDATLYLGDNVTTIGSGAFYGRTGLKSIVMDQVTTVGADAFRESGLRMLNAPRLVNIGNYAFRKCTSLETANLPRVENITSAYVLADCTALKSVYFENVQSLNQYTFNGDKKLEKITINRLINADGSNMPSTMTIDASAPCKIYVPYRSLSAYPSTWSGKPVVSFDISATANGDTYILADHNGRYALISYMPSKTASALTLPATLSATGVGNISIYAIEYGAFSTVADTLQSITLPASVAQLTGAALNECKALQNIYVNSGSKYFASVNGVLYSKDSKMLVKFPAGRTGTFDMTASNFASTVGIAANAFENASGLTQIIFPASLRVIDSTAFAGCSKLHTVQFTGTTPPVLMGAGIFDTSVEDFKMVIPTTNSSVVTAYLCAYNFAEYEPYIELNGNAAPDSSVDRNQVGL